MKTFAWILGLWLLVLGPVRADAGANHTLAGTESSLSTAPLAMPEGPMSSLGPPVLWLSLAGPLGLLALWAWRRRQRHPMADPTHHARHDPIDTDRSTSAAESNGYKLTEFAELQQPLETEPQTLLPLKSHRTPSIHRRVRKRVTPVQRRNLDHHASSR
jgi:hypothetical protein